MRNGLDLAFDLVSFVPFMTVLSSGLLHASDDVERRNKQHGENHAHGREELLAVPFCSHFTPCPLLGSFLLRKALFVEMTASHMAILD